MMKILEKEYMNNTLDKKLEQKIKDKIPPNLWYKYFYEKPVKVDFNKVLLPKVNRKFS